MTTMAKSVSDLSNEALNRILRCRQLKMVTREDDYSDEELEAEANRRIGFVRTRFVSLYSVSFRGIYGRNRSVKHTSTSGGVEAPDFSEAKGVEGSFISPSCAASVTFVTGLAEAFATKIDAKKGDLRVTRYDNCEVSPEGTQVIPIMQGVVTFTRTLT